MIATDAAVLEAEAEAYPEERGEILLTAAAEWLRCGEVERATGLLAGLIDTGGEDGCWARAELAEHLFAEGRVADGYLQLSSLASDPALRDSHCGLVAELLAGRGDLDGALQWYDRFVARLTSEEIEQLRGPRGWLQFASVTLRGRRQVSRELGLPPDAMDEIVPVAPGVGPLNLDDLHEHLDAARTPPRQLRMLTFQRAERAEARRRWPEVYPETDQEYYPAAERRWRELAERGVPTIRVVPVTVTGLVSFAEQTGGSPTDSAVKIRYLDTVADQEATAWPPQRNAPCWCGSAVKYKKCCGRAG